MPVRERSTRSRKIKQQPPPASPPPPQAEHIRQAEEPPKEPPPPRAEDIPQAEEPPEEPPPPRAEDVARAEEPPRPLRRNRSGRAVANTLASTATLARLLPSGTLLAFQLLTPVFTNNGSCDSVTRSLTQALLLLLAASCFLACLTDSFRSPDGILYYGLATLHGMWLFDYPSPSASDEPPDLVKYRLRFIDFIHAVLSVLVFASVALRDKNVVTCLYPHPEVETQEVLDVLPLGVGLICSLLFVVFPTRRHGIGYPVTDGHG